MEQVTKQGRANKGRKPLVPANEQALFIPAANDEMKSKMSNHLSVTRYAHRGGGGSTFNRLDQGRDALFDKLYRVGGDDVEDLYRAYRSSGHGMVEWLASQGMPARVEWAIGLLMDHDLGSRLTDAQVRWLTATVCRSVGIHFYNYPDGTVPMVGHRQNGYRAALPMTKDEVLEWAKSYLPPKPPKLAKAGRPKGAKNKPKTGQGGYVRQLERVAKAPLPNGSAKDMATMAAMDGLAEDMATLAAMLGLLVSEIRKQTKVMASAWGVPLTVDGDVDDRHDGVA